MSLRVMFLQRTGNGGAVRGPFSLSSLFNGPSRYESFVNPVDHLFSYRVSAFTRAKSLESGVVGRLLPDPRNRLQFGYPTVTWVEGNNVHSSPMTFLYFLNFANKTTQRERLVTL